MTSQVPIERLAMRRVDEFGDRGLSIVRTISTIVSGTLFFESLNSLQRPLRSGEALRFERSSGEMRTVRLEPGHLTMSFHGRVARHEDRVGRKPAEPHADLARLAARPARPVAPLGDQRVSVRDRSRGR